MRESAAKCQHNQAAKRAGRESALIKMRDRFFLQLRERAREHLRKRNAIPEIDSAANVAKQRAMCKSHKIYRPNKKSHKNQKMFYWAANGKLPVVAILSTALRRSQSLSFACQRLNGQLSLLNCIIIECLLALK